MFLENISSPRSRISTQRKINNFLSYFFSLFSFCSRDGRRTSVLANENRLNETYENCGYHSTKGIFFFLFTSAFTSIQWMYASRNPTQSETNIFPSLWKIHVLGESELAVKLFLRSSQEEGKLLFSRKGSWDACGCFLQLFPAAENRLRCKSPGMNSIAWLRQAPWGQQFLCCIDGFSIPHNRSKWPNSKSWAHVGDKCDFHAHRKTVFFPFRFSMLHIYFGFDFLVCTFHYLAS